MIVPDINRIFRIWLTVLVLSTIIYFQSVQKKKKKKKSTHTHKKKRTNTVVVIILFFHYDEYPKILYTKVSDKMALANSADPDQIAEEQCDESLLCLPSHLVF